MKMKNIDQIRFVDTQNRYQHIIYKYIKDHEHFK